MNSVMVVPLTARDRTLGAMTFVWAESGRQYTTRELELAEELGRRAGLALDHARLFAREHAAAETLQRALLPAELPDLPGFELVVRYVPSDARDHAGGDWYDAFRLPGRPLRDRDRRRRRARDGGRGDDGPDPQLAARLRAQGRRPGRGDRRPARARRRLAPARSRSPRSSTSCSTPRPARASSPAPATCRRCSSAPAARATSTRRAARRSASAAPARARSGSFTLAPGETLWLFTDGLVESRRRPIDVGPRRARRAAGPRRGRARRDRRPPARRRCPTRATTTSRCSGYAASARCASASRRMRDTCICETPTRAAISRCTRSSTKRSRRTSRSRGVSVAGELLDPQRVLDAVEPGVRAPELVGEAAVAAFLARDRRVEAGEPRRALGQPRLGHLLGGHPAVLGDLGDAREAPEVLAQRLGGLLDARDRLLHAARDVDRPRAVAEVTLELAEDRRHRVGRERDPAVAGRSGRRP